MTLQPALITCVFAAEFCGAKLNHRVSVGKGMGLNGEALPFLSLFVGVSVSEPRYFAFPTRFSFAGSCYGKSRQ